MVLTSFFFYLFAAITVASAFLVIASRQPVHSVLFLILAFFNSAGLFMLVGAEFLALLLVVVYVGAVAVLFLFVVMMLDVDFAELRQGFLQYLPIGALVAVILVLELILVLGASVFDAEVALDTGMPMPPLEEISNIEAIGLVLYTDYVYFFQAAGLVLLVAMVGAIVLTLRHREGVKRQDINVQNARTPEAAIEVVKVKSGQGL
ncbi:MAG: NADH-quinone oxidoreductase subunit J [Rhizobiales bacterium]|nr:NADH-quinone oxidoreductase subunit J [Hyphomicrobiales bacterium]MBO6698183.1 NADH-quinone oxidoreductase subunit J [Hyphomicrobiales bacterium]MBO6735563.1 NADH-quinone oxidoreductase subunit J [Hyphomicrobiales bacterium]MBO6910629.1 NADH-quinone oxidoreductase subunit J [Hyphomicrobiales bacterium]MBO6956090.1 NADH-quinone oxidoreductase subunit J [Hyphomicrobiales bacterium]